MKVFHRIIALVLTCSLLIGCLIITASAEEVTVYDVDGGWDVSVYVGTKTQPISDFADPQHPSFMYMGTMRGVSLSNDTFTFPYGSVTVYGKFSLPSRVSVSNVMVNGYAAVFEYIDDAYYFSVTQNFATYLNNYGQDFFIDIYDSNSAYGNFCLDYVKVRKNSWVDTTVSFSNGIDEWSEYLSAPLDLTMGEAGSYNGYVVPEGASYISSTQLNQSNVYTSMLGFTLTNTADSLVDAVFQLRGELQYGTYVGCYVRDNSGAVHSPDIQVTSTYLDSQDHVFTDGETVETEYKSVTHFVQYSNDGTMVYMDPAGSEYLEKEDYVERVFTYDVTTSGTEKSNFVLTLDLGKYCDNSASSLTVILYAVGASSTYAAYGGPFLLITDAGYYLDASDVDLGEKQTFFNKIADYFDRQFGNLMSTIQNALGVKNPDAEAAVKTQTDINNEVNVTVTDYVATWEANVSTASAESDEAVMNATPALLWLSGHAQDVYSNMGWFRYMYIFVALVSVHMLILSKSGLAHKLGNMSHSRESKGDG